MPSFTTVVLALGACLPTAVISQGTPPVTTPPPATSPPSGAAPAPQMVAGTQKCLSAYIVTPTNQTSTFIKDGNPISDVYSTCMTDPNHTLRCANSTCTAIPTSCQKCHSATIDEKSADIHTANDPESSQNCTAGWFSLSPDPAEVIGQVKNQSATAMCLSSTGLFECKLFTCTPQYTCDLCAIAPAEDTADATTPPGGPTTQGTTPPSGQVTTANTAPATTAPATTAPATTPNAQGTTTDNPPSTVGTGTTAPTNTTGTTP